MVNCLHTASPLTQPSHTALSRSSETAAEYRFTSHHCDCCTAVSSNVSSTVC